MSAAKGASGDPRGSLDSVSVRNGGQWAIFGWAADPDAPSGQMQVHIYVNGQHTAGAVTHQPRPDVERAVPYAGPNSGFEGHVWANSGDHVCVYAINQGGGSNNTTLGCRTIPGGPTPSDPRGHVDLLDVTPGMVRLVGWAGDPDAPKNEDGGQFVGEYVPTLVELHLDRTVLAAAQRFGTTDRPDVKAAFPDTPNAKGFDFRVPVLAGLHKVCAYAINSGREGNNNTTLGCWTIRVPDVEFQLRGLRGNLDEVRFGSGAESGTYLNARGWAWDADGTNPVGVTLRGLDIGGFTSFDDGSTGEPRPDVRAAHPTAPPDTGFTVGTVVWLGGTARTREFLYLCAYGVDADQEVLLGCRMRTEFKNPGEA